MEEILSSIKRVIEESETPAGNSRARRGAPRPIAAPDASIDDRHDDDDNDTVLELSQRVPFPAAEPVSRREPIRTAPPTRATEPAESAYHDRVPPRAESIVSPDTAQASRGPLEALSRMIVKPENPGSDTLEGMVREMLRPMLRDWLDANLPSMVEAMVAKEIARISGRGV
ncbi:DUF2497 domain-containing protein [Sphingomonas floccifaciens]|uniref:DUF2497 domain-containing protein n=2 Tax=Sphingomonas floccifaciens TaxID=1844115 RepID=A0ABW4NFY9_9SPHN